MMHLTRGAIVALVLAAGCEPGQSEYVEGSPNEETEPVPERPLPVLPTAEMQMETSCPTALPGVTVELEETPAGVALVFVGPPEATDELRERVEGLAANYEELDEDQPMRWHLATDRPAAARPGGAKDVPYPTGAEPDPADDGDEAEAPDEGQAAAGPPGVLPDVESEVVDVAAGARLVLTPDEPGDRDALLTHIRFHREQMESGRCWITASPRPQPRGL